MMLGGLDGGQCDSREVTSRFPVYGGLVGWVDEWNVSRRKRKTPATLPIKTTRPGPFIVTLTKRSKINARVKVKVMSVGGIVIFGASC